MVQSLSTEWSTDFKIKQNKASNKDEHKAKISLEIMTLSSRDYTVIKVGQVTYHQGDVIYDIPCSFMSLVSVSWTLFRFPGLLDNFRLYIW